MKALLMLIALVMLALAAMVGVQRASFTSAAVPSSGVVVDVQARETRCGRRPRRACTKFTAIVEYTAANDTRRITVGAGQSRGRGNPASQARYRVGEAFALRIHPTTREALPDSFPAIWGQPLVLGIGGVLLAFFGLQGARRR